MTSIDSQVDNLDAKFERDPDMPRRVLYALLKVAAGVILLFGGVAISSIGIEMYYEGARSSSVNAKPIVQTEARENRANPVIAVSLGAPAKDAPGSSSLVPNQDSGPIERSSQSSETPSDLDARVAGDSSQVLAEPLLSHQTTPHAQEFVSVGLDKAWRHTVTDSMPDTTPSADADVSGPPKTSADQASPTFPPKVENAVEPAELAKAPSPAEIKPPVTDTKIWRVQLISLGSRENAEAIWLRLQQANRVLLDELTLHVQTVELSKGTFHRVQAGPLPDRAAAASLCNAMKSRNQDCLVVAP